MGIAERHGDLIVPPGADQVAKVVYDPSTGLVVDGREHWILMRSWGWVGYNAGLGVDDMMPYFVEECRSKIDLSKGWDRRVEGKARSTLLSAIGVAQAIENAFDFMIPFEERNTVEDFLEELRTRNPKAARDYEIAEEMIHGDLRRSAEFFGLKTDPGYIELKAPPGAEQLIAQQIAAERENTMRSSMMGKNPDDYVAYVVPHLPNGEFVSTIYDHEALRRTSDRSAAAKKAWATRRRNARASRRRGPR